MTQQLSLILFSFLPYAIILLLFYVILIRPQQKHRQRFVKALEEISTEDKIITSGGMIGQYIQKSSDKVLEVQFKEGLILPIYKNCIIQIEKASGELISRGKI